MKTLMATTAVLLALNGVPAPGQAQDGNDNDPFEGFNRAVWEFNQGLDFVLLKPLAQGYRFIVPEPGRDAVGNFFLNLSEPINFLNASLQGERDLAGNALARFLINSTFGLGGLFDAAGAFGHPYHREDFGQTLAVWGVGDGGYFMIPIFGPSTVRDALAFPVDIVASPWGFAFPIELTIPLAGLRAVDQREGFLDQLEELEQASLDFYASVRSIFLQRRAAQIANGREDPDGPRGLNEDLFEEDFDEPVDAPSNEPPGEPVN